MEIKVIPQVYLTPDGYRRSWSVIVDGKYYTYYTYDEFANFLKGLCGEMEE